MSAGSVSLIRVGLVGAGPWARMFHAPMLACARDLALSAVWARRSAAAEELAVQFGARAVSDFDQLLENCDAVAFSVPPDVQPALAVRAAQAGKHLLLEKPLAVDVAQAVSIAEAVDASGVASQLMLTYRFGAPVRSFLAAFAGAQVGHAVTAWISGPVTGSLFDTPWRHAPGAALLDLGPHVLDLADVVAGPIVAVRAAVSGGVYAVGTMHDSGATGHVMLSGSTPDAAGPLECTAVTDRGRFVLDDPTPNPLLGIWAAIADEFARAIRGEAAQPIDVHRGVRVQRLLAAVTESAATEALVTLNGD